MANAPTLDELRQKNVSLLASAKAVQENADIEKRALTPEQITEVDGYFSEFESTEMEIARREKLEKFEARLSAPQPRVTEPPPPTVKVSAAVVPQAGSDVKVIGTVAEKAGNNGFATMGEFGLAVKAAAMRGTVDPRLRPLASASSPAQEAVGADGGYLVPPDFRTTIMEKVQGEDSLLGRTDQQTTISNSVTYPVDETTPWQTSGGLQVYWEGEASSFTQSKLQLKSVTVRANKIAALVPVTDELLEDAPSLNAYMSKKVPDKLNYKINDALINGDGVGKPLGILNSPALITQAAEGSQTAGTINTTNVVKMWSRMYAPLRRNAVWLINQDAEAQIYLMTIPASAGVSAPAYLPNGAGLVGAPNGTLMGRPIVYSEAAQPLGTPGDITLVDWTQYMTLMKAGGVRADTSIHLWFDQGVVAFRFTMRIGGVPWWSSSITRAKSSNALSFAVALASR